MLSTEKIIEIANQYGTPIYILDKEHLGKRIHDIQTILGNDGGINFPETGSDVAA